MQCPVCPETQLAMTTRQDIEIDYCPKCRGVWLDRGELDKIIERSQGDQDVAPREPQGFTSVRQDGHRDDRRHGKGEHGSHHGGGRHGSFLRRLFD